MDSYDKRLWNMENMHPQPFFQVNDGQFLLPEVLCLDCS